MLLNMKPFMKGYWRVILFIKRHLHPFIQKSEGRQIISWVFLHISIYSQNEQF